MDTARGWVPLTDPELVAASRGRVDPMRRLALLVEAYGRGRRERTKIPDVLLQAEEGALRFVRGRVERGDPAFVRSWDATVRRYERRMTWIHETCGSRVIRGVSLFRWLRQLTIGTTSTTTAPGDRDRSACPRRRA